MAIVPMRKVSICALKKDRKAILEKLQSMGVMEIVPMEETEGLAVMDTLAARQQFERNAALLEQALGVLEAHAPEEKSLLASFEGREKITGRDRTATIFRRDRTLERASRVVKLDRTQGENRARIGKLRAQIVSLVPWQKLQLPLNFKGTERTAVFLGTLAADTDTEATAAFIRERTGDAPFELETVERTTEALYLAVLCLKDNAPAVEEALRAQGFARPASPTHRLPAEKIKRLEKEIASLEARNEELEKDIGGMVDDRESFKRAEDYFRTRAEKYRILGELSQSESAFFVDGYVPERAVPAVQKAIGDGYGAAVEVSELPEGDPGPTLLSNNKFAESVEGVLESYGLPTRGHVDPSAIMSVFYVFFFGMMFSDGGYGLLMMAACGFVLFKYGKTLKEGMRKTVKLFFWCGVSTAFWGFMYGGFFGDAIDVVGRTFFGYAGETALLRPLWFEPMREPMRLLVWCMFFGLIHLFFGLGIKGYEYLKQKDYVGFVSDVLSWFLFLLGLIFLLLPSSLFASIAGDAFDFSWANAFATPAKVLALVGLALILVMQERAQKNWVLRILLGAYDVYGVSGWLSDVLSYSRLLALGLATGVIAQVINMMGSMGGGTVFGAIMFIIVFIVGHALNFAINVLGAYVHTNRLQFVEFFGKFYEGGGKPFEAFTTVNQYTEVEEEAS